MLMNAPTFPETAENLLPEKTLPGEAGVESEISNSLSNLVEQERGTHAPKIDSDGERIQSSVALFTAKSIKELEGLTFELHGLQEFLKSETERVQRDIDNALAGLRIIIDTISPWRNARQDNATRKPAHHANSLSSAFASSRSSVSKPSVNQP
jgi:hypothetical protein